MASDWSKPFEGLIPSVGVFFTEENWVSIKSVNGHSLATYRYNHDSPKGLLFMFHGLNFTALCMTHIAKHLNEEGFLVCAMDFENFGRSQGEPGVVRDLFSYVEDGKNYIEVVTQLYPDLPVFLLGESLGGFVALELSIQLKARVKGMVLLAPAIGVYGRCLTVIYAFLVLATSLFPNWRRQTDRNRDNFSSSPVYSDWARANPDAYNGPTAVITLRTLLRDLRTLAGRLHQVSTPFLAVKGGEDYLTSIPHVHQLLREALISDKKLIFIPGMRHAISSEPLINEILEEVGLWLKRRL